MSTDSQPRSSLATLKTLTPYLWPSHARSLRVRVVIAMSLLLLAKVANIYVPLLYKKAVDALQVTGNPILLVPLGLIIAYGGARILALVFSELRDAVFAHVGQNAIRTVGLQVFRHLHALSLRFHLNRKTGGLSRSIERGTKGIQTLLSFLLFTILPTLFEILAVVGLLWHLFDWRFALVTFITVTLYIGYTLAVTEWRNQFRREMTAMIGSRNRRRAIKRAVFISAGTGWFRQPAGSATPGWRAWRRPTARRYWPLRSRSCRRRHDFARPRQTRRRSVA